MPYTRTGKWQQNEWFEEMGVDFAHPDPTDDEIGDGWAIFYEELATRAQRAEEERIQQEQEAEAARLAEEQRRRGLR